MVAKVWGTANGQDVIFSKNDGGCWDVAVPWEDDGEYVAEIWAEDEAGNRSHVCQMLFAISGHVLQVYVIPRGYRVNLKEEGGYTVECVSRGYQMDLKEEGGYTIERVLCERCN